jgi:hypothetical protein
MCSFPKEIACFHFSVKILSSLKTQPFFNLEPKNWNKKFCFQFQTSSTELPPDTAFIWRSSSWPRGSCFGLTSNPKKRRKIGWSKNKKCWFLTSQNYKNIPYWICVLLNFRQSFLQIYRTYSTANCNILSNIKFSVEQKSIKLSKIFTYDFWNSILN